MREFISRCVCFVDKEVTIRLVSGGDASEVTIGKAIEVRGVVKDPTTLQVNGRDYNMYESDFDMVTYEQMLDYYHGMCKHMAM